MIKIKWILGEIFRVFYIYFFDHRIYFFGKIFIFSQIKFNIETRLFFQVIAATNRIDILDPALLRSGRLDRKIEFPAPTEEARARIMQIHARKMNVCPDVNYEELAR